MKIRAIVVSTLWVFALLVAVFYAEANRLSADDKAITEAIQAQNTPLLIQSLITKMKNQLEKDDDTFPELIREVEAYVKVCPDTVGVAVLHSMLAEMYQTYYNRNQWTISQRTNLEGYVPEDIREWTSNLFTQKVNEELTASLQPAVLLQQTPVSTFKAILTEGKSSSSLRPTLYDFLAYRAIDLQPSDRFYQDLLAFRRTQSNTKALVLAELAYLDFTYNKNVTIQTLEQYEARLDSLLRNYAGEDFSNDLRIAKINVLQQLGARRNSPNNNSNDSTQALIYTLCKEGIRLYPNYPMTASLKNTLANMTQPNLNMQTDKTVYPGKSLKIKLKYTNLPKFTLRIYQSLRTAQTSTTTYDQKDLAQKTLGKLVKEIQYTMPDIAPYQQADTTLLVPMEQMGLYEFVISAAGEATNVPGKFQVQSTVSVTRLVTAHRNLPSGETEVWVTDYESGKPVKDAFVTYYSQGNSLLQELGVVKSDREGLAVLPKQSKINAYRATLGEDKHTLPSFIYPQGTFQPRETDPTMVSIFTDRGIYRPGQTVFFKGIAYGKDLKDPHVVADKTFNVIFRDANFKEIATKTVKTNAFGSFNGEFTIPKQTLSGNFSIHCNEMASYIRVEEYKRPTFQVEIEPIKGEVMFGHQMSIQGKAQTYSGVALQTGQVSWRIQRHPFWLRSYMFNPYNHSIEQVANGTVMLDDKGNFTIPFIPEKQSEEGFRPLYQTYEVIATLTDSKGETQEARFNFSVGSTGIVLILNVPNRMDKDAAQVTVEARTINNEKASATGSYTIYTLLENGSDDQDNNPVYKQGEQVATGNFTTGQALSSSVFSKLPSGRYRLQVEAVDKLGQTVKTESDIVLYSKQDKRPPVFSHTWLVTEKIECLPGEEAVFVFGTSDKPAYVLYEIYSQNKLIERKPLEFKDENRTFRIPFKEEYGEGFIASFTFVKEGKMYVTQIPVQRTQPNRKLTILTETFRDHLLPGSKENWKFRILDTDSTAVSAEVLASMFDASLEQLYPYNWMFEPVYYINLQAPRFSEGTGFAANWEYESAKIKWLTVADYQYDRLNWQGILERSYRYTRAYGNAMVMAKAQGVKEMIAADNMVLSESVVQQSSASPIIAQSEESGERISRPTPQIRDNFAETAFFYPSLVTDASGDVAFSFTMPESNTTWKLQLLAQTKGLNYGYLSEKVITSKPLMVLPNLPRFMREGDEVTISTQIINQSDAEMKGRVSLELFDPETDQPVVCLTKSQKPFTLAADSMTTAQWTIPVPKQISLIGCRIVAESDKGSDGEQHLIPILSNQLLITESTPFFLTGEGEKQIKLTDPKGIQPFRYTLELSANPVWYAVQALPTLTEPENDNILSWFASYYSNTLAGYIVQAHPRIQKVIRQWSAQGGNASTLLSSLEKNQELKNILLEETPWVLAADNETEQKQRLSVLFDLNRADGQREAALQQLLQQQNSEGGWSWFKGFPASRSITLSILKGMTQLIQMNAIQYGEQEKMMQIRALKFLDQSIQRDYEQLRNSNTKWQDAQPTPEQIDYLFVRSGYRDIPELGSARDAIRFYTAQAAKYWNKQSLYSKGEIAWLMHANGQKQTASDILAWLKKTATTSAEKGMYWANNRNEDTYFTSPIDTHCLLMSIFHELAPNTKDTDLLKQWLLNQKRTQNWASVPSTVNAIYALILTGSDWLNENNTCTVQWGGQSFSTADGDAGIGYIKEVISQKEITPAMQTVILRKQGSTPAWGAVYNQYFQSIDQVSKQKGGLNVEKKLFIETNSGSGLQISPVEEGHPLQVGDKVIVRLVVRSDRAMDYVYLKDLRAGCFEPASQLSGAEMRDGLWYYRSPEDVSENFFINHLPQGTFVLEYGVFVSRSGEYAGGISTIQCLYAPEFVSHTEGRRITVN